MLLAAIDSFAAFALVGVIAVWMRNSHYDVIGARLRGGAVPVAIVLTESGRWKALTALGAIAAVIFLALRAPLWIPIAILVSQITSQAVIEGVKRLFRRMRPGEWLVRVERGYSYPSGHSSTAVTFFCAWALVVARSPIPNPGRDVLEALLVLWALGVAWSRLALGAHYVTDVIGGWLFGTGWLCLMIALAAHVKGPVLLPGLH